MTSSQEVVIEGKRLKLTNLSKVLYPKAGFTKAQAIDYYLRIAPALLPHLRDRPLTLKRYPDGVEGEYFYEKNCPAHRPPWVKTAPIWSDQILRCCRSRRTRPCGAWRSAATCSRRCSA